jgi:uncharacterized repeat protein (TIGR03803 family)
MKTRNLRLHALTTIVALGLFTLMARSTSLAAEKHSSAPTLTVLYTFLGEADGASPNEVALDPAGNLYGTAYYGGNLVNCGAAGCGVAFKVDTKGHETLLNTFTGQDGANPLAGLLRDNSGTLYGNTGIDGASGGGTVFKLRPSPRACVTALCPWNETVLHNFPFQQSADGSQPQGDLIRDANGNLYGTTLWGGNGCNAPGCGTVFKVDPQENETILYNFEGSPNDGAVPSGSLLLDADGNLYGTTQNGGTYGYGTVFELSPSGSGWKEQVLYNFTLGSDGGYPMAGLVADPQGNLYGTTALGGTCTAGGCGVVFELSPTGSGWALTVIHNFTGSPDGASPTATLLRDNAGNLYGTTNSGGTGVCSFYYPTGCGTVFELTPTGSGWMETILYSFTGAADGAIPLYGPVVMDGQGNLYGATTWGGDLSATNPGCTDFLGSPIGCGVVFKLSP